MSVNPVNNPVTYADNVPDTKLKLAPREATDDDKTLRLAAPGTGMRDTWAAMGPGIAAAMTGIGASHIMHAPTAGAQYGYAMLWIIPFAYFFKYCAFEFAHRYTMVRGESILEGYYRIGKGKGNWPLWYLLFQAVANTFGIAGRTLGCAALLWAAFPFMPLEMWGVTILLVTVAIIWAGRYQAVEMFVKIAIIIFAVAALTAFVLQMPPPGEYLSNLAPVAAPAGAALLFGSMWGYFPTTVEVGVMQSNWAVDKRTGMVEVKRLKEQGYNVIVDKDYMRNYMKLFHRDMNISYIISMITGMTFLIIGAVVLNPIGLVPKGTEMGLTIASIYTETFGSWIFPVIIAGATAALFSTVFTYFDGQARVLEECIVRIHQKWNTPKIRMYLYRGFQVAWVIAGTAIIYGLPRPIFVVQIASVLALLFSPIIFWLTLQSLKNDFTGEEREYLPGTLMMAWAWSGIIALALISAYVLYLQFIM